MSTRLDLSTSNHRVRVLPITLPPFIIFLPTLSSHLDHATPLHIRSQVPTQNTKINDNAHTPTYIIFE
jgi:hypothetical protein